jgi:hypothetical protein
MRNAKCEMQKGQTPCRYGGVNRVALFTPTPRLIFVLHFAFCILHFASEASAQQLLDRIVARVSGTAITLSELQAARGLGIVEGATEDVALQQMIDRQLLLTEVARFPPQEPTDAAVAAEVGRERAAAGSRLAELMVSTGTGDDRLRDLARDTLRIDGYVDQRFGTAQQVTQDEAAAYYDAHPEEFRRNGVLIPFEEALPVARERANAQRRRAQLDRWLLDLRARADIAIPTP